MPYPWSITIPKIGAHSTLVPLGLDAEGALAVPPVDEPMQASWYAGADPRTEDADHDGVPDGDGDEWQPGESGGPAVLSGHVDGTGPDGRKGFPGIFARLPELAAGDEILIDRVDGSRLRFVVTEVQRYSKDALPWDRIMAETEEPELRAITCGGEFDRASGHYRDNDVIFAELAPGQSS